MKVLQTLLLLLLSAAPTYACCQEITERGVDDAFWQSFELTDKRKELMSSVLYEGVVLAEIEEHLNGLLRPGGPESCVDASAFPYVIDLLTRYLKHPEHTSITDKNEAMLHALLDEHVSIYMTQYQETEQEARSGSSDVVDVYLQKYKRQSSDPTWKESFACKASD